MPSTTPDLRMAAARGFSASTRLGGGGACAGFASGSLTGGPFGTFASAGHMASKLGLWSGRTGGDGAAGADAAGERQSGSRFLSDRPGPPDVGAAGANGWRGDKETSSSCAADSRAGLRSIGVSTGSTDSSGNPARAGEDPLNSAEVSGFGLCAKAVRP